MCIFVFAGRSSNMKLQISLLLVGLVLAYAQIQPVTRTKKGPPPPSHVIPPRLKPHRVSPAHGVPPPRRQGLAPVRSSLPVRKDRYNDGPDHSGGVYPHRTPVVRGSIPTAFKPVRLPNYVPYPSAKPQHHPQVLTRKVGVYPRRTPVLRGLIPTGFKPARLPTYVPYPAAKPQHHPAVLTRTKSARFLGGPMRYVQPAQPYTMPTTFPPPPPPTTVYYPDTPDVQKEEEEEEES